MTSPKGHAGSEAPGAPVDFAFITALQLELDAVLQHLDGYEVVRIEGQARPYFLGHVGVPGTSERYSVVVAKLLGMGNDEAAVTTTRLIMHWRPANVLMVGIAGGVPNRVGLGDVVIGQFSFYYEQAKLTPAGSEPRSEQFPGNRLLFGRATAYEATDWKSDIGMTRPGASPRDTTMPVAHGGPIGSGEKVIADDTTLPVLLKACPKMLAVAMEGAGVARACADEDPSPRFLEVRGICDFADANKNDMWQHFAAHSAASFVVGFLRSRPVTPLAAGTAQSGGRAPLLLLRAQSLAPVAADALLDAFGVELKGRDMETVLMDFTDLTERGRGITNPEEAARRLLDVQGPLLDALARRGDAQFVFHGMVHIPLAVLAGHLASDRQPVRLFDFHPNLTTWRWPDDGGEFPDLRITGVPGGQAQATPSDLGAGEAVVRLSVTYPVTSEQTTAVVPNSVASVDMAHPDPARGVVRSEAQTRAYGRAFRQVLDALAKPGAGITRIHLCYAGPVSLAFHLGQQISENIHPPVTVWNYSQRYEWGIDLGAALSGEPCVVRPSSAAAIEGPAVPDGAGEVQG